MKSAPATIFSVFFVTLFAFASSAAMPYFSETMPNTENDAALEYFDLSNSSCEPFPLFGFSASDLSGKSFAFTGGSVLPGGGALRFYRGETKIQLNNDSETLFLKSSDGQLLDTFSYATSVKGIPIYRTPKLDPPACLSDPVANGGGVFDTGDHSATGSASAPSASDDPPMENGEPADPSSMSGVVEASGGLTTPSTSDSDFSTEATTESPVPDSETEYSEVPEEFAESEPSFGEPINEEGDVATLPSGDGSSEIPSADTQSGSAETDSGVLFSSGAVLPEIDNPVAIVPPLSASSSTLRASPEFLRVVDSDGDRRYDRLEITYSEALTGSADPATVSLHSSTGGLFGFPVLTSTGHFSEFSISGSTLTLVFSGRTLEKDAPIRIDSSTLSALRLKSPSGGFGLFTLVSGLPVAPFGLTTSFDGYSKDRISFFPTPQPVSIPAATTVRYFETSTSSNASVLPVSNSGSSGTSVPIATKKKATALKSKSKSASGSVNGSRSAGEPPGRIMQLGEGIPDVSKIRVVPSTGVDLLPSGSFLFECRSKKCPVAFRVENPPKTWGHWRMSGGKKRFGASTGTVGDAAGSYRFAYVVTGLGGETDIPVTLRIVRAPTPVASNVAKTTSASTKKKTSVIAASKSVTGTTAKAPKAKKDPTAASDAVKTKGDPAPAAWTLSAASVTVADTSASTAMLLLSMLFVGSAAGYWAFRLPKAQSLAEPESDSANLSNSAPLSSPEDS